MKKYDVILNFLIFLLAAATVSFVILITGCENVVAEIPEQPEQQMTFMSAPIEEDQEEEEEPIQEEIMTTRTFTEFQKNFTIPEWLIGKELWISEVPETEEAPAQPARFVAKFTADGITEAVNKALYPNPITPESFASADGATYRESTGPDGYKINMTGRFARRGKMIFGQVSHDIKNEGGAITYNGRPADLR